MRSLGLLCILISQLTPLSRQYWCVDPLTGEEQQGTRISSSPIGSALPDCSIRHQCKINCPKELLTRCEHGVKLDHKGCPVDERCECQNPCDVSKNFIKWIKIFRTLNALCPRRKFVYWNGLNARQKVAHVHPYQLVRIYFYLFFTFIFKVSRIYAVNYNWKCPLVERLVQVQQNAMKEMENVVL